MGYTKLIQSGRIVEFYEFSSDYIPLRASTRKKRSRAVRIKKDSRRSDNLARLRRTFVRIVQSNLIGDECPLFFTFTMLSVCSTVLAYECFSAFSGRIRRIFGTGFKYIAVPEFQKRGAVHFHALYWGLPKGTIENERNTRTIQRIWGYGYVDCFSTDGNGAIAGYMAKYMSKSLSDKRLLGKKAYTCSRNMLRPVQVSFAISASVLSKIVGVDNFPLQEKNFPTQWLGSCNYKLFEI